MLSAMNCLATVLLVVNFFALSSLAQSCSDDSMCASVNGTNTTQCCVFSSTDTALTATCVTPAMYVNASCQACDACKFDGSDAADCKVYGKYDGVLTAWFKCPQACLDAFQIKREAVDQAQLESMFPNADGSGGNINSFVNYLRFNEGSVVFGIRAGFPAFFEETTPGRVEFRSEITVDGQTYFCRTSESSCWNALKLYFADAPGSAEMAEVGRNLYRENAVSRELEQSLCRIRLCAVIDGSETLANADSICPGVYEQVDDRRRADDSPGCSSFGFGPGTTQLCGGGGGGGGGAASISRNAALLLAAVGMCVLAL